MTTLLTKCMQVCTSIESKDKSFTMTLDFLYKHVGHNKAKTNKPIMAKGIIYYYKNYVRQKKKTLYVANLCKNVAHQLSLGEIGEKKKKKF